ncbi:chymotrypsin A-like [Haliotis rubra]|uniref:chymotrypsin A-like n=1 Tax=Haliotis rubra TaxID=36100 RepID=UPI001EE59C60|nr:chymotrypsin A-like [Haliotis rubra]
MTYCCYPLHHQAPATPSPSTQRPPVASVTKPHHTDCENIYKGYCVNYTESCRSGDHLSFSHCGFLKLCCYPESYHPGTGALGGSLLGSGSGSHITGPNHQTNNNQPSLPTHPSNTSGSIVESRTCGITLVSHNHRIVGGGQAEPHEYPWQVSLRYNGQHLCGGTLIDDQWVLTAAHCFQQTYGNYWTVAIGLHDIYNVQYSQVIDAARVFTHAGYSSSTNSNDVAIVKLAKRVDTQHKDTRTACLPDRDETFDGLVCTVTGWGAAYSEGHIQRYLQEVDVPIMNNKLCAYYMGSHIHASNICAGYSQGGKDACQGDSGGPLVCRKGGVWKIVGVVSWGIGCGEKNAPGVYTRVSSFIDWIDDIFRGGLMDTVLPIEVVQGRCFSPTCLMPEDEKKSLDVILHGNVSSMALYYV